MSTETPSELRPARTTPRLGLPIPGDAGPADYVTDTGAICDRLDVLPGIKVPVVTSLPASPGDGDEVYFDVDPDLGVKWHLRHNAARTRWELLGGPPLTAGFVPEQGVSQVGVWLAVEPHIAVRYAGDYIVSLGANVNAPAAMQAYVSVFTQGGGDANLAATVILPAAGARANIGRAEVPRWLPVGDVFLAAWASVIYGAFGNRWLAVRPIWISTNPNQLTSQPAHRDAADVPSEIPAQTET